MRRLALSFVLAGSFGCHKLGADDCELSNTCPDELFRMHEEIGPDCGVCLRDQCAPQAGACFGDFACSRAVRCQLETDPFAYQNCLAALLAADASAPDDPKGAWEGNTNEFVECLDERCKTVCKRAESDWRCVGEYAGVSELPSLQVALAVRSFDSRGISPIADVSVQLCRTGGGCQRLPATDARGSTSVPLGWMPAPEEHPYFKLVDDSGEGNERFPKTRFYPGLLGTTGAQPLALLVIEKGVVEAGNGRLIGEARILEEAGQSLILPDACRVLDKPSARNVTLHTEFNGQTVPTCFDTKVGDAGVAPCTWYSDSNAQADIATLSASAGFGGGVVGLGDGEYQISVCDAKSGQLVARRTVTMEPGWMTIARTWPLTASEREKSENEPNPCQP